ncbi:MAG: hypothetical protein ACTSRG_11470 [Candidatus Helarchaeota archaeon]
MRYNFSYISLKNFIEGFKIERISKEEATKIKENLIKSLNLPYWKIRDSLYKINKEEVNVKLTRPRASGRYWFNIQRKADSYIWICYNSDIEHWEAYYWIPAMEMWKFVKCSSYRDRTWEEKGYQISNFEIDIKSDLYIGGEYKFSIKKFKNLKNPPL